jgi:hypothetical protein
MQHKSVLLKTIPKFVEVNDMAIIKEFYTTRSDGVNLYRSYSDLGLQIRKVGTDEIYDDVVDVEPVVYIYEETDRPVVSDSASDNDVSQLKAMAYDIVTGEA